MTLPPMSSRRRVRFLLEFVRAVYWLARIELGLRRRDLPTLCRELGIGWDLRSAAPPGTERAVYARGIKRRNKNEIK